MKTTEMHFGLTVLQTKISATKNTSSTPPVIAFNASTLAVFMTVNDLHIIETHSYESGPFLYASVSANCHS